MSNRLLTIPCSATLGLSLIAITLLTGCPRGNTGVAPTSQWEALERVNDNLAQISQPVQYKGIVSFKWVDKSGHHNHPWEEASLIFAQPQYFLLDVRTLVGVVAQGGSNNERYWAWVEPDVFTLWWGFWKNVEHPGSRRIPFSPNELLDALLLRPLPATLTGGLQPMLRVEEDDQRLLFVRLAEDGQPSGWREVKLDPAEPYMPREIIDRLPDGHVQMHAYFDNYRRIENTGPFTPRSYKVFWPIDDAEFRLDVTSARWRPDLSDPELLFEFPEGWQGQRERLDIDQPVEEQQQ